MELRRHTWTAALKLAFVLSTLAAIAAIAVTSIGEVSETAIVLPVIVLAFVASWIQSGRIRRREIADAVMGPVRSVGAPTA